MSTIETPTHDAHDEHGHHHVTSMRLLNTILVVLLIFTVLTVAASRIDLGESLNLWLAIAIASFKALLVAAFFMHLLHDKAMNSIVLFFTMLTIGLFFLFTLIDMDSRHMIDPMREGPTKPPSIVEEVRAAAIASGELDPDGHATDDHGDEGDHGEASHDEDPAGGEH
jgi:cytochrome c oxidase subunit 4